MLFAQNAAMHHIAQIWIYIFHPPPCNAWQGLDHTSLQNKKSADGWRTSKFRIVEDVSDNFVDVVDSRLKQSLHGVLGQSQHTLRRPTNLFVGKLVHSRLDAWALYDKSGTYNQVYLEGRANRPTQHV